jgi:hypothetical protein
MPDAVKTDEGWKRGREPSQEPLWPRGRSVDSIRHRLHREFKGSDPLSLPCSSFDLPADAEERGQTRGALVEDQHLMPR